MKKHRGVFIFIGIVWAALVGIVYSYEFLHSVLGIDLLPESTKGRWIVVISAGFIISLITLLYKGYLIIELNFNKEKKSLHPAESLANSIYDYAAQLHKEGRDYALITLRNNFSITLHILGFHKIRTQLGEITLKSSTIIKDDETRAEVLTDDLGWANYLLDKKEIAKTNILRGIEIIGDTNIILDKKKQLRLILCKAKGYRHLGIIEEQFMTSISQLNNAYEILMSFSDQSLPEIKREIGQIYHAKSLVIAMSFNIHKSGILRGKNESDNKLIQEAIELVRKSSAIFKEISDLERYAKSLFLEVRLLEATENNTEAMEVAAIRDRTLAASEWMYHEGFLTIIGK